MRWKPAPASAARTEFGLKKFPAAGKTGTAYDFTDALFAGYDSAIHLRGLGWVRQAAENLSRRVRQRNRAAGLGRYDERLGDEHIRRKEIARPPGLQTVEICSRSGLLATDKCYDTVKNDSGRTCSRNARLIASSRRPSKCRRNPATSMATHAAASYAICPKANGRALPSRSTPPQVTPVVVKGPTLIADADPYNAVRSTAKPKVETPAPEKLETTSAAENDLPDPTKPVLKAQPVTPADRAAAAAEQTPVEIRRAEPVRPMDQVPQEQILKSTPPPTLDLGNQ